MCLVLQRQFSEAEWARSCPVASICTTAWAGHAACTLKYSRKSHLQKDMGKLWLQGHKLSIWLWKCASVREMHTTHWLQTVCLSFPSRTGPLSSGAAQDRLLCPSHPHSTQLQPLPAPRDPRAVEAAHLSFSFQTQNIAQPSSAFPAELLPPQALLHAKNNCPWESRVWVLQVSKSPGPKTAGVSLVSTVLLLCNSHTPRGCNIPNSSLEPNSRVVCAGVFRAWNTCSECSSWSLEFTALCDCLVCGFSQHDSSG